MQAGPRPAFSQTRLRPGYSIAQVDKLIDEIEAALAGSSGLTAADVRSARFNTTRLKAGYDQREVDVALDDYQDQLRQAGRS